MKQDRRRGPGTYNMIRAAMVTEGTTRENVVNETKEPSARSTRARAIAERRTSYRGQELAGKVTCDPEYATGQ